MWHIAVVVAVFPIFVYFLIAQCRARRIELAGLYLFVVIGVIGNAIFTSAVSGVVDRYHSRLVWLIVFLVLISAFDMLQNRGVRRHSERFQRGQEATSSRDIAQFSRGETDC